MEAKYVCPECREEIVRGGRNRQDAKESLAYAVSDHLAVQHDIIQSPDEVLHSGEITIT